MVSLNDVEHFVRRTNEHASLSPSVIVSQVFNISASCVLRLSEILFPFLEIMTRLLFYLFLSFFRLRTA